MARAPVPPLAAATRRPIALALASATLLLLPFFVSLAFFVAWFALIPFFQSLSGQRWKTALAASLVWGLVYHGCLNYWLVPTIIDLGPFANTPTATMKVWAGIAFLALLLWQGLFALLFGGLAWRLLQQPITLWTVSGLAVSWLLVEWLRSLGPFGYPWGLMAATQIAFLPLAQTAAWVGSYGLGGLIVLVNGLGFLAWQRRQGRFLLAAFVLLACISVLGWLDWHRTAQQAKAAPKVTAAVVQGNFGKERWRPTVSWEELQQILMTHLRMSRQAAQKGAEVIVWSETALPWRLREDSRWGYGAAEVQRLAQRFQVALFVGAGDWQDARSYNACFVFAPKGWLHGEEVAYKMRLVPFGEYLPGRHLFPWLAQFLPQAPVETAPGTRFAALRLRWKGKEIRPAIVICFESLFAFHLRHLTNSVDANLVIILTNDSWFGATLAPVHHARIAILRAIELRRAVVRGAGTGISLIVAPTGEVKQIAPWNKQRLLIDSVPLMDHSSLYSRLGDLPFVGFALLLVLGLLLRHRFAAS